jgi:hypothetical protein
MKPPRAVETKVDCDLDCLPEADDEVVGSRTVFLDLMRIRSAPAIEGTPPLSI